MEHYRDQSPTEEDHHNPYIPKLDMLAKGVVTGVVASTITQTGRNIASRLFKNPIVLFGLGLATGYLAHKYRREILATMSSASEQGRKFVLNKKEKLQDMLAEAREAPNESDISD